MDTCESLDEHFPPLQSLACLDCPLPRDPSDPTWVLSFDASAIEQGCESECHDARMFFDEWGFVVFRNALSEAQCVQTQEAMWKVVENASAGTVSRSDPKSWSAYRSAGKYGLSLRGPCFAEALLANRCRPSVTSCLALLVLGVPSPQADAGVLVGHDRFTIYRPTLVAKTSGQQQQQVKEEEEKEKEKGGQEENKEDSAEVESGEQTKDDVNEVATEKSRYGALETKMGEKGELVYDASLSTGQANVHLDLNPWWWLEDSDDPVVGLNTLSYGVNDNAGTDASTAVRAGEGVQEGASPIKMQGGHQDFIRENNLVVSGMGRHVQAVLNLRDNRDDDGGTLVVPKFHRYVRHWASKHRELRLPLPWVTLLPEGPARQQKKKKKKKEEEKKTKKKPQSECGRKHGLSSPFSLSADEGAIPEGGHMSGRSEGCADGQINRQAAHSELLGFARRVSLRSGSLLVWDQTVMHGTQPNRSSQMRMAQFLKAFPRNPHNDSGTKLATTVGEGSSLASLSLSLSSTPPSPSSGPSHPACGSLRQPDPDRLKRRAAAIRSELQFQGLSPAALATKVGSSVSAVEAVLGLDVLNT